MGIGAAVPPGCWAPQQCWSVPTWKAQTPPAQPPAVCEQGRAGKKQRSKQGRVSTQGVASKKVVIPSAHGETRTTLKLSNLPANVTTTALIKILNEQGMDGLYSFVFVAFDFI